MAAEWFYLVLDQELGPVSSAELKALAADGDVSSDTLVRKGPAGKWVLAGEVKGLFSQVKPSSSADGATWTAPGETASDAAKKRVKSEQGSLTSGPPTSVRQTQDGEVVLQPLLGPKKGIGGWLTLPAIGLILGPLLSAGALHRELRIIQTLPPEVRVDPSLWLSVLIQVAMIIATIFVAVWFFQERRIAVSGFIGLMVASIFANIVQLVLNTAIFGGADTDALNRSCVYGAVWIPYFLWSKRVKNTFTK